MDQNALIRLTLEAIRQVRRDLDRPVLGVGIAAIGPVSTPRGTIPVSYTHLDVYKRQPVDRQKTMPNTGKC